MASASVKLRVGSSQDNEDLQKELIDQEIVWYRHKNQVALVVMAVLILLFCLAEFGAGMLANSLALRADAFHMLSNLISLVIGYFAIRFSHASVNSKQSYGWVRAEIIGGLSNGVFSVAVCFFILLDAAQRFAEPPVITRPRLIITVGAVGLLVNIIGLVIFATHDTSSSDHSHGHGHGKKDIKKKGKEHKHKHNGNDEGEVHLLGEEEHEHEEHHEHSHEDKKGKEKKANSNLRAVILHVLGDAVGSVGAIATGFIIYFVKHPWAVYADPAFGVLLTFIILRGAFPLIKRTADSLLLSVPASIEMDTLQSTLLKIDGVVNVHELHIWQLGDLKNIATLHTTIDESSDFPTIAEQIKSIFHKLGVHSTTIQPEYVKQGLHNKAVCKMACDPECSTKLCCDPHAMVPKQQNYGSL